MNKTIESNGIQQATDAVNILKTAILQSQARAVKAVNQEQLALYYGIGRYISANTRNKHWGSGMIKSISQSLRSELPGLRGFGESILNDDDRREGEEPPIGIILCKSADKAYVEYIMQDFRQPMGVATYKTADEMDEELMKVLPSKEQLEKLLED